MFNGLKDFTVRMIAGANVATVIIMLLVGFSDLLNPQRFPAFANAGLLSCLSPHQSGFPGFLAHLPF